MSACEPEREREVDSAMSASLEVASSHRPPVYSESELRRCQLSDSHVAGNASVTVSVPLAGGLPQIMKGRTSAYVAERFIVS